MLDFLFNRRGDDPIGLYFKGGTSRSRAYGLTAMTLGTLPAFTDVMASIEALEQHLNVAAPKE